jgi:DHA2 family multidrug resistance protein
MSQFNLYVDFNTVALSRIVMGVGMGMVFVPLTSLAFSTIKKEEMGNATSIFSLVRNIAGSFGVAIMTTLLARRAQFHQFRFSEQLNPLDLHYQIGMNKAMQVLSARGGASEMGAKGMVYQNLMRQSSLNSFVDAFHFSTLIMLCIIPLVLLLKKPKDTQGPVIPR